ncbi:MAG: NADH:flavin oxidoreductase/NADH oxidase family protein [Spirochaetia bacterium]|nr:NADH:flavin oxidoreductase/NADH oxidase family protein [Spirochaetia bacterium]
MTTNSAPENLNKPLTLKSGLTLPNRIAKGATSEALADRDTGRPSEGLTNVYTQWGAGGAGLLITGNVIVDREGRTEPGNVILRDERHLTELKRWAEAAQASGARLFMQINHAGRQTPRRITSQPVAPSAVPLKGFMGLFATPRPLEHEEIVELIGRYATAASVAQKAGFSGVEIHAAHGYLASQFLSPRTNLRDDRWGGDAERRRRFLIEIVRAIRAATGPNFSVAVKLNSADFQRGGFSEEESMAVVDALEQEGIDLLEISGGSYEQSAMMGATEKTTSKQTSTTLREAYFLDYAKKIRARTKLPLMLTGGMRTVATMEKVVAEGHVDIVGIARPLFVEPDLPHRLLNGSASSALQVKTAVGIKMLDDMLNLVWYQAQLRRMATGLRPRANLGRLGALVSGYFLSYAFNPLSIAFAHKPAPLTAPPKAIENS